MEIQTALVCLVAAFLTPLEPQRWYGLTMELAGDQMRVSLDEKPIGYLKSPGLAHLTKSHFHFGVSGGDVLFDDVRVWTAAPIR